MTIMNDGPHADTLRIEVVIATAERQELLQLQVPAGTTAAGAIDRSGLAGNFSEHIQADSPIGIWGRLVDADHVLIDGDRVEIYRPLLMDPREARRLLAIQGRSMNQGDAGSAPGASKKL